MATPPELQQLLALSRDRTAYQNPLFQAVTQMAYRGLPTYAREGTQLSGSLTNTLPQVAPQATDDGFDMDDLMKLIAAASGGSLLSDILRGNPGGGGLIGDAIRGLKKILGLGDDRDTVQGNKPFVFPRSPFAYDPRDFMGWPPNGGSPEQIRQPRPNVTTSETFTFPEFLPANPFQDFGPVTLPPDRGNVGPGMQWYYSNPAGRTLADPDEE